MCVEIETDNFEQLMAKDKQHAANLRAANRLSDLFVAISFRLFKDTHSNS